MMTLATKLNMHVVDSMPKTFTTAAIYNKIDPRLSNEMTRIVIEKLLYS